MSVPTTVVSIGAILDDFGLLQASLAAGARSDDATPTISGTLSCTTCAPGTIQIETVSADQATPNPQVLGSFRLTEPGSFTIDVRDASAVIMRAYVDLDGDGPDPEDQRFDLSATVIQVSAPGTNALRVDLDQLTVQLGS